MKEYVLVTGDFTPFGGMDSANYHLAEYLAEQPNTQVHLVAFHVEPPLANDPNVMWHHVKKVFNSYTLSEWRLNRAGQAVVRRFPGSRVLVNGGNCYWGDINWVHYVHAAWVPEAANSFGLRLRRGLQHRKHLASERRAIRSANLIIANSNRTRSDIKNHFSVGEDRIETIYYGTDTERFHPGSASERDRLRVEFGTPPEAPLVAFIGALGDRRKGFDILFAAWEILCGSSNWDATLLVIGTGAELPHWQRLARQKNLVASLRFLGFRTDVPRILQACDVLVAPARYEAYGLGVHEALCCAIPAIVSASAGIAERYPRELSRLLLAEPVSAELLAERLRDWREHMSELKGQVLPFSERLRSTSWDDMARKIVERIDAIQPLPKNTPARE